jgi:hypothetical protein
MQNVAIKIGDDRYDGGGGRKPDDSASKKSLHRLILSHGSTVARRT